MQNTALLVIDMQTALLQRDVYEKDALIANINALCEAYRAANLPVVFARHANGSFLKADSPDWQIYGRLSASAADCIIDKTHSSVFKEKAFLSFVQRSAIGHIAVCGLVSNGCVQAACADGLKNGLRVTLISDAHSTWSKNAGSVIADWNEKLKEMGTDVVSAEEYLSAFASDQRRSPSV